MQNNGRLIHLQAEKARENGDFTKSLELLAQAIVSYQSEKNLEGISLCLSSQALSYRHLFDKTKAREYLVLAKHLALAAIEISKGLSSNTTGIALYNLGKVLESLGENLEALKSYQEAIEHVDSESLAMKAEMMTRLEVLKFKNGDDTAFERFGIALEELKNAEEKDNYAKAVWLSGAYMHMAEALIEKDVPKAKELLGEAKKIIDSDMRLKLRKQQLEKISVD